MQCETCAANRENPPKCKCAFAKLEPNCTRCADGYYLRLSDDSCQ